MSVAEVQDAGADPCTLPVSSSSYLGFDYYAKHLLSDELKNLYADRQQDPNTAQAEAGGVFYIILDNGFKLESFG